MAGLRSRATRAPCGLERRAPRGRRSAGLRTLGGGRDYVGAAGTRMLVTRHRRCRLSAAGNAAALAWNFAARRANCTCGGNAALVSNARICGQGAAAAHVGVDLETAGF